jgi:hypothetical protein
MSISQFNCNIYLPSLQDGYKIVNSAWNPVYKRGEGEGWNAPPLPPRFGSAANALQAGAGNWHALFHDGSEGDVFKVNS